MYKEIYLMLTEACPNRCEYCYIKSRDKSKSMTFDFIDETLQRENPDRVIFFGGEPLLELGLMEKTLEKYHDKMKFQVVTSTSVNFKEFVTGVNKKYPLNEVQLSWDGFNNINRVDASGNPIQNKVYDNILWAIEQGLKFDIKCVIGNENVHLMSDIHKEFLKLKEKNVSGQFVIAHRDLYKDDFYEKLEEQLPKTFDLNKLYTDHLNKIIAFIQKDRNFSSCNVGKYIVITPDGKESLCTALSQESKMFDSQLMQQRCKHSDCVNCEMAYLCDGGCRYERYNAFGDNWESNYLKSTCRVVGIYDRTIRNFLSSMNPLETRWLLKEIFRYKNHIYNYYRR